jgi:hypothetical protein
MLTKQEIQDLIDYVGFFDEIKYARCPVCGNNGWTLPDRVVSMTDIVGRDEVRTPGAFPFLALPLTCRRDRCHAVRFLGVEEIKQSRSWLKLSSDRVKRRAGEQRRALTVAEQALVSKAESLPSI